MAFLNKRDLRFSIINLTSAVSQSFTFFTRRSTMPCLRRVLRLHISAFDMILSGVLDTSSSLFELICLGVLDINWKAGDLKVVRCSDIETGNSHLTVFWWKYVRLELFLV